MPNTPSRSRKSMRCPPSSAAYRWASTRPCPWWRGSTACCRRPSGWSPSAWSQTESSSCRGASPFSLGGWPVGTEPGTTDTLRTFGTKVIRCGQGLELADGEAQRRRWPRNLTLPLHPLSLMQFPLQNEPNPSSVLLEVGTVLLGILYRTLHWELFLFCLGFFCNWECILSSLVCGVEIWREGEKYFKKLCVLDASMNFYSWGSLGYGL